MLHNQNRLPKALSPKIYSYHLSLNRVHCFFTKSIYELKDMSREEKVEILHPPNSIHRQVRMHVVKTFKVTEKMCGASKLSFALDSNPTLRIMVLSLGSLKQVKISGKSSPIKVISPCRKLPGEVALFPAADQFSTNFDRVWTSLPPTVL